MRRYSSRVVGLAACGLLLAGWLSGSMLSPPVAQSQVRNTPRRAPMPAALPAIEPLHALRVPRSPAPAPTRNPFAFGRRVVPPVLDGGRGAAVDAAAVAVEEMPAASAPPAWTLLGVAVDADGSVTAILSGAGDVHLVRAGDRLPGDVEVVSVGGDTVQLRPAEGPVLDLRLR